MNSLRIGSRLAVGFAAVLSLLLAITLVALWRLQATSVSMNTLMSVPLEKERLISDWSRNIHSAVRRAGAIVKSRDPAVANYFAEESEQSSKESGVYQNKIEALLTSPDEVDLFHRIGASRKDYIDTRTIIMAMKKRGQEQEANALFDKDMVPKFKTYLALVQDLLNLQREHLDAGARGINRLNDESRVLLAVLGLLALSLGAVGAWVITRSITRPLHRALEIARRVASGDLTGSEPNTTTDETGQLLNALSDMRVELGRVIGAIRTSTDNIGTASNEIAVGNADLSARTERTASNLQQTASSMHQLTATVSQTADAARSADKLALSASVAATRGGEVVASVISTMHEISESSHRIGDIISVIDGIAFQTNILALNAAVEAVRAGEQGRGFAVVAAEVRQLAQRSAEAAKAIKSLIDLSVRRVDSGSELVRNAGASMTEIVSAVQHVSAIIGEISTAASEQKEGVSGVDTAVKQLDAMTQQNAALVEESAAAAQSLKDQAVSLAQLVARFHGETDTGAGAGQSAFVARGGLAANPH